MVDAVELDHIDKQILSILQDNAKESLRDIEKKINLSTTAIRSRIKRLKELKVIKQYLTLIDCKRIGYQEMMMASLRIISSIPIKEIKEEIEQMEKVRYAYIVTGEYPLFIMAKCLSHEDTITLLEELRNLPGVEEIKTQIVLDRIKEDPTIIIPE